ncbi:hypothetical protein Aperf_G00000052472 [Anoplocephala perfoliata]
MGSYKDAKAVADYIKCRVSITPRFGIICGSGLGRLAETVIDPVIIHYSEIKQFPPCTVEGHAGNLVFGKIGSKEVILMQGRFHPYEGYAMSRTTLPIRVMKLLGVETLIITNAAGALNLTYNAGDLMIIKDHINLPGLSGLNPLVGPNEDGFGPRFPSMTNTYTKEYRELAKAVGEEMGLKDCLHEGIYVYEFGPSYETVTETNFVRLIGADAVGMSTAHEATVAKHAGMKVFAVSLITNKIDVSEDNLKDCSHEEVLETSNRMAETMKTFISKVLEKME